LGENGGLNDTKKPEVGIGPILIRVNNSDSGGGVAIGALAVEVPAWPYQQQWRLPYDVVAAVVDVGRQ
jgi:hypothetical protein